MTEEYKVIIETDEAPNYHEKAREIVKSQFDEALVLFDKRDMTGYTKLICGIHLAAMTSLMFSAARTNPVLYLTMVKTYCQDLELDFTETFKILMKGE